MPTTGVKTICSFGISFTSFPCQVSICSVINSLYFNPEKRHGRSPGTYGITSIYSGFTRYGNRSRLGYTATVKIVLSGHVLRSIFVEDTLGRRIFCMYLIKISRAWNGGDTDHSRCCSFGWNPVEVISITTPKAEYKKITGRISQAKDEFYFA